MCACWALLQSWKQSGRCYCWCLLHTDFHTVVTFSVTARNLAAQRPAAMERNGARENVETVSTLNTVSSNAEYRFSPQKLRVSAAPAGSLCGQMGFTCPVATTAVCPSHFCGHPRPTAACWCAVTPTPRVFWNRARGLVAFTVT